MENFVSYCLFEYVSCVSEKQRILTDLTIWKLESVHFTFIEPPYKVNEFRRRESLTI